MLSTCGDLAIRDMPGIPSYQVTTTVSNRDGTSTNTWSVTIFFDEYRVFSGLQPLLVLKEAHVGMERKFSNNP